jgi:Gas vesicle protein.
LAIQHANSSSSLADILERILDKGIVIAGDIKISLADVELLNIKIRLLVASVDKAREMGIDWWQHDPYLSSQAQVSTTIPALKGTDEHNVLANSSKQQPINSASDPTPKENLELKTEANIYETQAKANYERKKPEPVIIDAIPVTDYPIENSKINLNGSSWEYSAAEKLDSELRDGITSSLGKPSVGKSIEKIPKK